MKIKNQPNFVERNVNILKDFTGSLVHKNKLTAVGQAWNKLIRIYVSLMSLLILFCVNKSLHLCTHQNNWTGTLQPFNSTGKRQCRSTYVKVLYPLAGYSPFIWAKPSFFPCQRKYSTLIKTLNTFLVLSANVSDK